METMINNSRISYFLDIYGEEYYSFLCMASACCWFTPHILYSLRLNFYPNISHLVVSDIIMSSLTTPIGYMTYKIHEEDRVNLYAKLSKDMKSKLYNFFVIYAEQMTEANFPLYLKDTFLVKNHTIYANNQ